MILVVLQQENSYGYEIMERLQNEFGFEEISPGSVYQTLRQMEKEGFCHTAWEPLEVGTARRMYSLTDEGEVFWVLGSRRVSIIYGSRRHSLRLIGGGAPPALLSSKPKSPSPSLRASLVPREADRAPQAALWPAQG